MSAASARTAPWQGCLDLRRVGVSQSTLEVGIRRSDAETGRRAEERQRDAGSDAGSRRLAAELRSDRAGQQRFQRLPALGRTRLGRAEEIRGQFYGGAHKSILARHSPGSSRRLDGGAYRGLGWITTVGLFSSFRRSAANQGGTGRRSVALDGLSGRCGLLLRFFSWRLEVQVGHEITRARPETIGRGFRGVTSEPAVEKTLERQEAPLRGVSGLLPRPSPAATFVRRQPLREKRVPLRGADGTRAVGVQLFAIETETGNPKLHSVARESRSSGNRREDHDHQPLPRGGFITNPVGPVPRTAPVGARPKTPVTGKGSAPTGAPNAHACALG